MENQNSSDHISSLTQEKPTDSNAIQIPQISLPKGGGALKGIDEKFEVNSANGTAGYSIPLPISPGRNNFSPSLFLSYNSGNGNGPFGLGWSIGLSSIQRKTDNRIPRYHDELNDDVFTFSGVEDLVPYLEKQNNQWQEKHYPGNGADGYIVKRYRPRLEGVFSRIEKIHHQQHGTYWKVTTRDNIATIYGRSSGARIADPEYPAHVFQWLPEFSYDDKGNWIKYYYKNENSENVPDELYEKNRKSRIVPYKNLYLKRICYGNRIAYYTNSSRSYDPQPPENSEYLFELVMDYGEHDLITPNPQEQDQWDYRPDAFSSYRPGFEIRTNRLCQRVLMFHHFQNEKQFVSTPEEEDFGQNYLVRSLDLQYEPSSINGSGQTEVTYLSAVVEAGYIRKPGGDYSRKALPAMQFSYQRLNWNNAIKVVRKQAIEKAPVGLTNNYQWVDLYGEGISGILTEQQQNWHYNSNLGDIDETGEVTFTAAYQAIQKPSFSGLSNGNISIQDLAANGEKQVVVHHPEIKGYIAISSDSSQENNHYRPFNTFKHQININLRDPNTRLIDLSGDGQTDIVVTEENAFLWYAADGKNGHLAAETTAKSLDEEIGPAIVFADQQETIFLADMVGDGLTDIVRIRNGEICYWANMGYGRFSAKVSMSNAPYFDHADAFNPQYLHLADVSGTGATDIIYLGKNSFKSYINLSGNAWSDAHEIDPAFPVDDNSKLSVIDLLGTGTSCIVWSSDLPANANSPMRYIDLMDSKKPHVMIGYKNNMGAETQIQYKSSTHYYLKDKLQGKPWITKLPFPVQVISKIIVEEKVTDVRFTTEYRYHHGYYDHPEREFRGFGMVEQIDSEHYSDWSKNNLSNQLDKSPALYQKPVLTKTWFHTGAFLDKERMLSQFKQDYWYQEYSKQFPADALSVNEPELPDAQLSDAVKALNADQLREAFRACKGMVLRQEVFGLDAPLTNPSAEQLKAQLKPYSVATHNCNVQLLQPRDKNDYGVFVVTESEAITISYERNETDFRMSHTVNTNFDDLGNILESASIVYGRNQIKADADFQLLSNKVSDFSEDVADNNSEQKAQLQNAFSNNIQAGKNEQTKTHVIYTQNSFAQYPDGTAYFDDIDLPHTYRLRPPYESKTFEITGLSAADGLFKLPELKDVLSTSSKLNYHEPASSGVQKRLIEHLKTQYLKDDLTPLPFGFYAQNGMVYQRYQLAFTPELVQEIYSKPSGTELQASGNNVSSVIESVGKYTNIDGELWIRSGLRLYKANTAENISKVKKRFYSPLAFKDPFGAITTVAYDSETFTGGTRNNDGYYLFVRESNDAIDNKMQIDAFNYRTLSPTRMIDINANPSSVLIDELGLVKALAVEGNGEYSDASKTSVNIIQPADSLTGLKEYSENEETIDINQLFGSASASSTDTAVLRTAGNRLLKQASTRFIYDFNRYQLDQNQPSVAVAISREQHFADNNTSKIQFGFEYSDGAGNIVMTKTQAEPGLAYYAEDGVKKSKHTGSDIRWIGSGRTVLNNKGNPVKQYEPYFSTNFSYEDDAQLVDIGVTNILHYDTLDRLIKTEYPDGTFSKVVFDSWKQLNYDQNDTILDSQWYTSRINNLIDIELVDQGKDPVKEKQAAEKAAGHANTPSSLYLDSLARPVLSIDHNGKDAVDKERLYSTLISLDIEGNTKAIIDSRGNTVMAYEYDMLGHRVYQNSMDAGERWVLNNLMGNPVYRWDSRDHLFSFSYDAIQRPTTSKVQGGDGTVALDNIYERMIYGEGQTNDIQYNLRGQAIQQYDTAGRVRILEFDFKGNQIETTREYNANFKEVPDWTPANLNNVALFDPDLTAYSTRIEYDALGRTINTITPDNSLTMPDFNETGLLDKVRVKQTGVSEKQFVKNVDYDAKGQRKKIVYGDKNGSDLAITEYRYDKDTFRLLHLKTTTPNGKLLQDLYYTYDPAGNISEIEDKSIPTIFFNNFIIEPKGLYQYDALYRLIEARGKEHAGQAIDFGQCDNWKDSTSLKKYSPGDNMAWRNYMQRYSYDPVGNILKTKHIANGGDWVRRYQYETQNNRLKQTTVAGQIYTYPHHAQHGFMESLPHLAKMDWNFKDEIQAVAKQLICNNNKPPETTYYSYDASGQRVRKVTEKTGGGGKKEERLYLGVTEIYKSYTGHNNGLERISLHITDDKRRIAMIDTRNNVNDTTDKRTVRFQFTNHLGSACLELDDVGGVISYEEYHPYGTTAYQAVNKDIKAATKRYRYTGLERDSESGLAYHSARYYIPWLNRWCNCDPEGLIDGLNVYTFTLSNPVLLKDEDGTKSEIEEERTGSKVKSEEDKSGNKSNRKEFTEQEKKWIKEVFENARLKRVLESFELSKPELIRVKTLGKKVSGEYSNKDITIKIADYALEPNERSPTSEEKFKTTLIHELFHHINNQSKTNESAKRFDAVLFLTLIEPKKVSLFSGGKLSFESFAFGYYSTNNKLDDDEILHLDKQKDNEQNLYVQSITDFYEFESSLDDRGMEEDLADAFGLYINSRQSRKFLKDNYPSRYELMDFAFKTFVSTK